MYRDSWMASPDGKTLTHENSVPGTNEKIRIVWDKQSGTPDI